MGRGLNFTHVRYSLISDLLGKDRIALFSQDLEDEVEKDMLNDRQSHARPREMWHRLSLSLENEVVIHDKQQYIPIHIFISCLPLSFPSPVLFKLKWLICSNALCIKQIMFHPVNPNLFYWFSFLAPQAPLSGISPNLFLSSWNEIRSSQGWCEALRAFTFPQGYISVSFETSHRNLSMILCIVSLFRRSCAENSVSWFGEVL